MKSIDLLPDVLRDKSLSKREIVLEYDDILCAIDIFRAKDIAILGWEGLLICKDGTHVPSIGFQGTVDILQDPQETWPSYVQRSVEFAIRTIKESQILWNKKPEVPDAKLYFCICPIFNKNG